MKEQIINTIRSINSQLPENVQLVAVSKYHPAQMIEWAYQAGQRIFGESHVQELQEKHNLLPDDIQWHFIGHLQSNKVKYIAPYISLIHSVDTVRLLHEISRHGVRNNRRIPCLLQLHIAQEETKFGFSPTECMEYLQSMEWKELEGISIDGIMCMATNTDDEGLIREDFRRANSFFQQARTTIPELGENFRICSWGMSEDYIIACNEGSNMVRIGSKIFGPRVY